MEQKNSQIISKTLRIESPTMPPEVDFIEYEIKKQGYEPIRWAIVNVLNENILEISLSAYEI